MVLWCGTPSPLSPSLTLSHPLSPHPTPQVRYTITINSDISQVIVAYETDVQKFIDGIGSAAGIVGAGIMFLIVWHWLSGRVPKVKKQKEEQTQEEQDKFRDTVAKEVEVSGGWGL